MKVKYWHAPKYEETGIVTFLEDRQIGVYYSKRRARWLVYSSPVTYNAGPTITLQEFKLHTIDTPNFIKVNLNHQTVKLYLEYYKKLLNQLNLKVKK